MGEVQAIQLTQDQARIITGVSCESLRHWRKNIPYLTGKSGKSARFSFPDLVCLYATQQVVESLGVSIGSIGATIDALFRLLADSRLSVMQHQAIVINGVNAIVCRMDEIAKLDCSGPLLVIPCAPLIEALRQRLLPRLFNDPQMQIPFPPQAVGA